MRASSFLTLTLTLLGALSTGCAPALSTMQPAHVAEKGHFQAEVGMDIAIPTGTIVSAIDGGIALAETAESQTITDEQRKRIFDAGSALALNPPTPVQHIGLAYTILDNWEVDLRYSVSAIRLGTRYQIFQDKKHKIDLTIGAGVSRYVLEFPVNDFIGILELEDYERWQFDFPIQIGKHGDWYRVWGGPRIMLTTFGTSLTLTLPARSGQPSEVELASFSGTGAYIGGQAGAALGYKYVFVAFELTLAQLFSGGDLNAFGQEALKVDLDSFLVYPAVGLLLEF